MSLLQKINHPNIIDALCFYKFEADNLFMLYIKMELVEMPIYEKFQQTLDNISI